MKRILTLLSFIGFISFSGCTTTDDVDTIAITYENAVPFNFVAPSFNVRFIFPTPILESDMVLVYRLDGIDNGRDVWQSLPETYFYDSGLWDFSFKYTFTNRYVDVYLDGFDNNNPIPLRYRANQTFRFVIVPANLVYAIDTKNYLEVVSKLNIRENQIHDIKL